MADTKDRLLGPEYSGFALFTGPRPWRVEVVKLLGFFDYGAEVEICDAEDPIALIDLCDAREPSWTPPGPGMTCGRISNLLH